jgi:hypothetical protein
LSGKQKEGEREEERREGRRGWRKVIKTEK